MEDYGSDFITITDEDGTEFELEVLAEVEYNGKIYIAVVPAADDDEEEGELELSLLRKDEEDGEEILSAIEDEEELDAVYGIVMDSLYDDEDEE